MSGFLTAIPVIGGMFDKVGEAIDRNVTSDEERLSLKANLTALYTPVLTAVITAQAELDKAKLALMEAMAKSDKFLVYSLRPLLCWLTFINWMLTKQGLISGDEKDAFYAFGIVFGVFGGTRGVEKIMKVFKSKEQI